MSLSLEKQLADGGSPDTLIELAFELAFFIHRDAATAVEVTAAALAKLPAAASAQGRRLHYHPTGRENGGLGRLRGRRNRISLGPSHLLQRLVYIESEPFERAGEAGSRLAQLDEEDMIVRFIKHLTRVTLRRNSFYVTIGVARLLHGYSTAAALDLHCLVSQEPDRLPTDDYCRSRKKLLMTELSERFGALLSVVRGAHGEHRFRCYEKAAPWAALVEECLRRFTPWGTACPLPACLETPAVDLPSLSFEAADPDREHAVEVSRIHALLHPPCFARLTAALGLAPPAQRLTVPLFCLCEGNEGGQPPPRNRFRPPPLGGRARRRILDGLTAQAASRRRRPGRFLSLRVDGYERAVLDLARKRRVSFQVGAGADLVEVCRQDGLTLAVWVLGGPGSAVDREASIVIEGGQRIAFTASPVAGEAGDLADLAIEVDYRETRPMRAAALAATRLVARLAAAGRAVARRTLRGSSDARRRTSHRCGLRYLWASGTVMVMTALAILALWRIGPPSSTSSTERPWENARGDALRTLRFAPAAAALAEVERIHVAPLGSSPFARALRQALITRLDAGGRFTVCEARQEADALLTGSATGGGAAPRIDLSLINADGETLWTAAGGGAGEPPLATPEEIAGTLVEALVVASTIR